MDTSLPPQRNSRAHGAAGQINALQSPAPIFSNGSFIYNGNDERVKSVMTTDQGTTTTYFVGNYYELTGSVVTKYYYSGSQRIAMRVGGTLSFLISDHLGSTSLSTDANGTVTSEQRYTAWGEVRFSSSDLPTKYTYTGQYSYTTDFGLMFYNARWVDPYLNLAYALGGATILINPEEYVEYRSRARAMAPFVW